MASFRIKQCPSYSTPGMAVFEVQERRLFWWEYRGLFFSLEEAERRVVELKTTQPVETKIVKEYN
jgi:hypothetical protein